MPFWCVTQFTRMCHSLLKVAWNRVVQITDLQTNLQQNIDRHDGVADRRCGTGVWHSKYALNVPEVIFNAQHDAAQTKRWGRCVDIVQHELSYIFHQAITDRPDSPPNFSLVATNDHLAKGISCNNDKMLACLFL
uniref:Uncharacterized protein n=1 Tax=Schistocephalus solidus TaxID=70667 RepID=A0A0X3PY11_SCHSO